MPVGNISMLNMTITNFILLFLLADKLTFAAEESSYAAPSFCQESASSLNSNNQEIQSIQELRAKSNFTTVQDMKFRKILTELTIDRLLENIFNYEGLAGGKKHSLSMNMLTCLKSSFPNQYKSTINLRKDKIEENKTLTTSYLNSSFEKVILINVLFKEMHRRKIKLNSEILISDMKQTSSYKTKVIKKYSKKSENIKSLRNEVISDYSKYLRSLSINSPLLFTTINDFDLIDWFNSKRNLSEFSVELMGDFPEEVLHSILKNLENLSARESIEKFHELRGGKFKEVIDKYKKNHLLVHDKVIKAYLNESVKYYSEGLYKSIEDNCDDKGKYIHYNNEIAASFAEDILQDDIISDSNKMNILKSLESWQCEQWKDRPGKDVGQMSIARIGALVTLGIGGLVWATTGLTGIGSFVGANIVYAGASLLLAHEVVDYISFIPESEQLNTAYYLNWKDIEELRRQDSDKRNKITSNIVMGISLGSSAKHALKTIRLAKAKGRRHSSFEVFKSINENINVKYPMISKRLSLIFKGIAQQEARVERVEDIPFHLSDKYRAISMRGEMVDNTRSLDDATLLMLKNAYNVLVNPKLLESYFKDLLLEAAQWMVYKGRAEDLLMLSRGRVSEHAVAVVVVQRLKKRGDNSFTTLLRGKSPVSGKIKLEQVKGDLSNSNDAFRAVVENGPFFDFNFSTWSKGSHGAFSHLIQRDIVTKYTFDDRAEEAQKLWSFLGSSKGISFWIDIFDSGTNLGHFTRPENITRFIVRHMGRDAR